MTAPEHKTNYILVKKCSKCGVEKTLDCFSRDKSKKYGINNSCKECRSKDKKRYYEQNREDCIKRSKEWREKNPERHKNNYQSYNERNRDKQKEYSKWWQENNRERARQKQREWRQRNKEHVDRHQKEYREKNRERLNAWEREYRRERRKEKDVKLSSMMRDLVKRSLCDTKSDSTANLLGYTKEDLEARLEYNFVEGMTWDSYGKVWSVDHSIPISHFLSKGEDRPWIINALSNLKPVWVSENSRKKAQHPLDFK